MDCHQYGKKDGTHVGRVHDAVMASEAVVKIKYAALVAWGWPNPPVEHVADRGTDAKMSCPVDAIAAMYPVLLFRNTMGCMGEMGVPAAAPASMYTVHCGGCDASGTAIHCTSMPAFPRMRGVPQLPSYTFT